jgi:hypothetical protein
MILQGLKPRIFKRLEKFRARWVAELPSVLWSLRTTPCHATGFTPFFMAHCSKAVLPTNIDYDSPRVQSYTKEGNQVALEDAIDQLDEARDVALPSISMPCGVTTSSTCALASSMSKTLYSTKFKAARTSTSYHHLGRGRDDAPTRDIQDSV